MPFQNSLSSYIWFANFMATICKGQWDMANNRCLQMPCHGWQGFRSGESRIPSWTQLLFACHSQALCDQSKQRERDRQKARRQSEVNFLGDIIVRRPLCPGSSWSLTSRSQGCLCPGSPCYLAMASKGLPDKWLSYSKVSHGTKIHFSGWSIRY